MYQYFKDVIQVVLCYLIGLYGGGGVLEGGILLLIFGYEVENYKNIFIGIY